MKADHSAPENVIPTATLYPPTLELKAETKMRVLPLNKKYLSKIQVVSPLLIL